ncbi:MAG: hypothetical protein ACJ8FT_07305 [Sphingomonas sp.]
MTGDDEPLSADFEEESSKLKEALKSCRTVVNNYRAILGGQQSGSNARSDSGKDGSGPSGDRARGRDVIAQEGWRTQEDSNL